MSHEVFGSFAPIFEKGELDVPAYLTLLNPRAEDLGLKSTLKKIAAAGDDDDAPDYVRRLLADPNWRPNLVGGVAALFMPDCDFSLELWKRIDTRSWVVPQLAAVTYLVDPTFVVAAQERLASKTRSPKITSSLIALLDRAQHPPQNDELRAYAATDPDQGGGIAVGWLDIMKNYLKEIV